MTLKNWKNEWNHSEASPKNVRASVYELHTRINDFFFLHSILIHFVRHASVAAFDITTQFGLALE